MFTREGLGAVEPGRVAAAFERSLDFVGTATVGTATIDIERRERVECACRLFDRADHGKVFVEPPKGRLGEIGASVGSARKVPRRLLPGKRNIIRLLGG